MDIFIHIHTDEPMTDEQREFYPKHAVGGLRAVLGPNVMIQPYEINAVAKS